MANGHMSRALWAAGTIVLVALPGAAQSAGTPETSGAAVIDAVKACRAVAAADQRLACFDKATAALDSAIQAHDITVLDKQEVRRTRRSLFGFSIPNIPLFGGGTKEAESSPEFTELDTLVTGISAIGNDRFDITITEGAVWRNTDPLAFPPKRGAKMHIKKGALGNYFLRFDGDKAVRGSRIR